MGPTGTPAGRRFQLEPGRQLVAWAGRSDIALADALAGLAGRLASAQRWIAAEQRSVPWPPDPSLEPVDIPTLQRGEAVEVTLTEATEWLRPSGVYHRVAFAGGLQLQLPDDFRETVEADVAWVVELFASRFAWEMETRRLTVRIATTPEALARLQSRQRATTNAWARSPVTRAGVNEIVMSAGFWTSGYTSGVGVSYARAILAHEYFHIAQFELAGPARHRTPGWLTEGTATWFGWSLGGQPPSLGDAQFGTTELNLASRSRPFDDPHGVGLAALAILIERSGPDSIIDFWRNLAPRKGVARSWQTAFRETFGLSSQEFYELFYEVRRPYFTVISGVVESRGAPALPRLSVLVRSHLGSSELVDVAPDGSFEATLPRFTTRGPVTLAYGVAVLRRGEPCHAEVGADRTLTWPTSRDPRPPLLFSTTEPSVTDFNIVAPASVCRERVRVRVTGDVRQIPNDLEISVCRPDGGWCIPAEQRRSKTLTATVPIPGDYIVALEWPQLPCPQYVAADGLTADARTATTVSSSSRSTAVTIRLDGPPPACQLEIRGQLLGREADWITGRPLSVTFVQGGDSYTTHLQPDGSFALQVRNIGHYTLRVAAPRDHQGRVLSCEIYGANPSQWVSQRTTPMRLPKAIRVFTYSPIEIEWRIHPDACRHVVSGHVTDSSGAPHGLFAFVACPSGGLCQNVATDDRGAFDFLAPMTGTMSLRPSGGECSFDEQYALQREIEVAPTDDNYVEWVVSGCPCVR